MSADRLRADRLAALPVSWRMPAAMVVTGRPVRFLLLLAVLGPVATALMARTGSDSAHSLLALVGLILAGSLGDGVVSADRDPARWAILFQRPERPWRHYARVFVLCTAIGIAILLAAALAGMLGGTPGTERFFARGSSGLLLGPILWFGVLYCVAFGISALVRKHDLPLFLLLVGLSVGQVFLANALGLTDPLRMVLHYSLLPIDAVFTAWEWLRTGSGQLPAGDWVHLAVYPLVWLCLGLLGLRTSAVAARRR